MEINRTNPFLTLPKTLIIECLSHLPIEDISLRVALVCQDFYHASKDKMLWQKKAMCFDPQKANTYYAKIENWKFVYIVLITASKIKELTEAQWQLELKKRQLISMHV
jgi:hypothetical protein